MAPSDSTPASPPLWLEILAGVATVLLETAVAWWLLHQELADIAMLYLLGIVTLATRYGYAASLTATALSVAALDFFFTTPYLSFVVDDRRHYVTFAIMAVVALLISGQTRRMRREAAMRVSLANERARLAEEAHRAQGQAQEERLRNALLSSVSHDSKTPLAVIQGAASSLLDESIEQPPERRREQMQLVYSEAGRLARLVRNLVDMTSLESGTLRVRKEWHSIEEIVGVAIARLEDQLEGRSLHVHLDEEASMALLDATLIEQVLVNLLENALKYTPAGTPVEIGAERTQEGVVIEVADRGAGIPAGKSDVIFEKFFRASNAAIGMGLGLTICRGILAAHEGRIWARNRPDGGASFRFLLPGGPAPALADSAHALRSAT